MSRFASTFSSQLDTSSSASLDRTPGKRTLTQDLPKSKSKSKSLKDEQREVIDLDTATSGDGFYDQRATVEAVLTPNLSARQLSAARRKNPRWVQRLGFEPTAFSSASPSTEVFAFDVATKQQAVGGLKVDGIAGPKTIEAITGIAQGEVIDDDRLAEDDPFGMHLIG